MKCFLETNTCVYFLKGTHHAVTRRLLAHHPDEIRIPSIVRAEQYAELCTELERGGLPIGPNDLMIASVITENDGVLIRNSEREFSRGPGALRGRDRGGARCPA